MIRSHPWLLRSLSAVPLLLVLHAATCVAAEAKPIPEDVVAYDTMLKLSGSMPAEERQAAEAFDERLRALCVRYLAAEEVRAAFARFSHPTGQLLDDPAIRPALRAAMAAVDARDAALGKDHASLIADTIAHRRAVMERHFAIPGYREVYERAVQNGWMVHPGFPKDGAGNEEGFLMSAYTTALWERQRAER